MKKAYEVRVLLREKGFPLDSHVKFFDSLKEAQDAVTKYKTVNPHLDFIIKKAVA